MTLLHYFAFLLLAFFNFISLHVYGKTDGVCISQGGRFPPFANEGKPPKSANRGPRDLTLCRVFRKKTCCDVSQTLPAFLAIRRLASSGEASQECLHLWELLECSICDPRVLVPCGVGDLVCGRASEWISNGTELCQIAGFSVEPYTEGQETSCYGEKDSLDYIANSWKSSESSSHPGKESAWFVEDLKQWIANLSGNERVSWAIGGMAAIAGLLLASKRKSNRQRQKQRAIKQTARRLGSRIQGKDTNGD